jgi:tetratricopeptide (TPR) repeat protein
LAAENASLALGTIKMRVIYAFVVFLSLSSAFGASTPRMSAYDLGRKSFESGRYARALDLFSQAISQATDSGLRNRAYYYQGLTLFELGYYYSSYISFRNVLMAADDKNKEIYEKAIKNAVIITDRLNMVERLGKVLEKFPPGLIASSVSALADYAMGLHYLNTGEIDKANSLLKSVNPESQFYPKALFHLGILETKKKNYKEAIFYFEKVMEVARSKRELNSLAELARLNLARSIYSSGDMEKSIEIYSQFLSSSPFWLTVLLEASWPLMRVNDTTVSLGNLHTILSPFYHEDLVGEGYILRATILFSLCKYEEMRQTLAQFFKYYDPVLRSMQAEHTQMQAPDSFYTAYATGRNINRAFLNFAKRDEGLKNSMRVLELLRKERRNIARYSRNEQMRHMASLIDEADRSLSQEMGTVLMRLHKRKLAELVDEREQANYLKVEIVTGEKELIEGQKGLPPKRVVDVQTSVASGYRFWPFYGEYWEDELGTFVYTTESACVN